MGYIIVHERAVTGEQTISAETRRESVRLYGADGTERDFSVEIGLDQLDELEDVIADVRARQRDPDAFSEIEQERVERKAQALRRLSDQCRQLIYHLVSCHHFELDELPSPQYIEDVADHTQAVDMLRMVHQESHASGSYSHDTEELVVEHDALVDELYRHAVR